MRWTLNAYDENSNDLFIQIVLKQHSKCYSIREHNTRYSTVLIVD